MPLIKTVRGFTPKMGEDCFLADNATIIGDVIMGDGCSVWFNAVLRGDVNSIRIGNQVNIQDGVVIHSTYERSTTTLGDRVSIGHNAIVHGATIGDDVLIGMGAIVMDNAIVKNDCLIAAGAVVLEDTICESGFVYAGVPAKKIKNLSTDIFSDYIKRIAKNYKLYSSWFTGEEEE